jgi:hypothetical protein
MSATGKTENCFLRLNMATAVLLLVGCAQMPHKATPVSNPPLATGALARSAQQIALAWQTLDQENAAVHPPVMAAASTLPPALRRTINLSWNAPIVPLLHKLALFAGYRMIVLGQPPATPIVATLHGTHTLFGAFRSAAEQGGNQVDVFLNAQHKTVEVRYVDAA